MVVCQCPTCPKKTKAGGHFQTKTISGFYRHLNANPDCDDHYHSKSRSIQDHQFDIDDPQLNEHGKRMLSGYNPLREWYKSKDNDDVSIANSYSSFDPSICSINSIVVYDKPSDKNSIVLNDNSDICWL